MGSAASVEEDKKEAVVEGPPQFLPEHEVTAGEDLLLAVKMGCLCQLSYKNTSVSAENAEYEEKWKAALQITDYKIWDDISGEGENKSIDSQALTGVIQNVSDRYPEAIPFVCFRGTKSTSDMIHDVASLVTVPHVTTQKKTVGTTGLGFTLKLEAFKKLGLVEYIIDQVNKYQSKLFVTGHSLGGAVTSVFTAELLHDYPDLFAKYSIVQVTFGAPRVFDKSTALQVNTIPYHNLRFVNQKDLIPTLPHWQMKSLYHTGDCAFATDGSRTWHTIPRTNINTHVEDQEIETQEEEDAKKVQTMTKNHRRFNFASDGYTDADAFAEIMMHFTIGGADSHSLSQSGGYLDQIVNSKTYKAAVESSTATVKATFNALPIEIAPPNQAAEAGKAVASLGMLMGKLLDDA